MAAKKWILPAAVTCSLTVGAAGGMYIGPDIFLRINPPKEEKEQKQAQGAKMPDLEKVEQAYELISEEYIEQTDDEKLVSGAIQGMLATLEDPYSVYMDKQTALEFNQSLDSEFEGIGTEIGVEESKVIIISPYKNSPAEKAGLKAKDEIIAVDGVEVDGLNVQEVSVLIRGEKGTKVKLKIARPGVEKPMTFAIKRDRIPVETVHSDMKGTGIGYIEITSFSKDTAKDFKKQLGKLEAKKMKGLMIDVRGNPGGLLESVEEILHEFIPRDKPYLKTEKRNGDQTEYFSELSEKKPYDVAVLIDNRSASASEILAGAMQEAGGYRLIGEKTFGKGTVQQAVLMDDGSNIKLTRYKWLTPDGNWIHNKGIKPDIKISQPAIFQTHPLNIDQTLSRDMTGETVRHAQEMLRSLGYEPGRNDGYYDLKTEIAVKAFQNNEKLTATGQLDDKTAKKMEQSIIEEMKKERNDTQLQAAIRYLSESTD